MLFGTEEEFHYHNARATEELALSSKARHPAVSRAHLALATLHRSRSELVDALRRNPRNRRGRPIVRADKEA